MPTLHWLTRDEDVRAAHRTPYRLLEEVHDHSVSHLDSGNMLIQGDNLEALKALLPFCSGRVKCIYIDPPYNTRSAFEHYDDNLEHTRWLAMIWPRLELLRDLLAEDGSIWVSIDNAEGAYLKVLLDEVFGRSNFVTTCVWQQRTTRENRKVFSEDHEYLHVYASHYSNFKRTRNPLDLSDEVKTRYRNPDNDPRGPWQSISANAQAGHGTKDQFYDLVAPNGRVHGLPAGRCWILTERRMKEQIGDNRVWFGKDGNGVPRIKKFLSEVKGGLTPNTLWLADEVGTNDSAKKHTIRLFDGKEVFETPKPEALVQRVLEIATNPGDLVLDSFLGSGTTAAVAHKMGRRWIGIEMGEHAVTHCVPRLRKVIEGEQGGISGAVGWQGGGGFRFYRLGPPVFDEEGHIRGDVRYPVLAAHVWFSETGRPWSGSDASPLLGLHDGRAYALLYNGILGDRRPAGGNVLTRATLAGIRGEVAQSYPDLARARAGYPLTVYGEQSRLTPATLARERIDFKNLPTTRTWSPASPASRTSRRTWKGWTAAGSSSPSRTCSMSTTR